MLQKRAKGRFNLRGSKGFSPLDFFIPPPPPPHPITATTTTTYSYSPMQRSEFDLQHTGFIVKNSAIKLRNSAIGIESLRKQLKLSIKRAECWFSMCAHKGAVSRRLGVFKAAFAQDS